jgi:hypothetical protein
MASEDTLLGNAFVLQIGDGNSPEGFVDACSVNDISGLGETKTQVDVTTYCDDARTFIGGLREGNEVTLAANLIVPASDIGDLFDAWDAGANVTFRFAKKDSPTACYLQWGGALLNWSLAAPVGEKGVLTFTVKISGGVTRVGFDV